MNLVPILVVVAGLRTQTGVVATYRGGIVTQADVESWNQYLQAEGRGPRLPPLQQRVETIVALRALDQRFAHAPPAAREDFEKRYRVWRLELAGRRVRDTMRTEAAPSEAEIRAVFEANPAAYGEPRSWVLENIFKRYPEQASAEDKAKLRRAMEEIRGRALAGEDFPRLARQESESETRLRGGSMGAPYLHQLSPAVAEVVKTLKAGDIGPVFEVPGGLALLRCTSVIEAKEPTFEGARRRIAYPRGEERFQKAWTELTDRLQKDLAPILRPEAVGASRPQDPVASFLEGASRRDLSRAELDLFLAGRGLEASAVSLDRLRELMAERVQLEGLFREAEARGLLRQEGDEALFHWKALDLRAKALEDALPVAEPTETELRAAFEARRAALVAPQRTQLEALKLRLKPDEPRNLYETARKLGERLAAGNASFEEAARALAPAAQRVDLGWLDDDQVWLLGLNVDTAVKATPAGGTTRLVQEGKELYLVHVLAKEPERQRSFDEVREGLRRALSDEARQRAAVELRRQMVEQQRIVLAR